MKIVTFIELNCNKVHGIINDNIVKFYVIVAK